MATAEEARPSKAGTQDEDMSPTVERFAVLRWMDLIYPKIPAFVQRTCTYDLQQSTLKDVQPQITDALDGFREEIREEECNVTHAQASSYIHKSTSHVDEYDSEEVEVAHAYVPNRGRYRPRSRSYNRQQFNHPKSKYISVARITSSTLSSVILNPSLSVARITSSTLSAKWLARAVLITL